MLGFFYQKSLALLLPSRYVPVFKLFRYFYNALEAFDYK